MSVVPAGRWGFFMYHICRRQMLKLDLLPTKLIVISCFNHERCILEACHIIIGDGNRIPDIVSFPWDSNICGWKCFQVGFCYAFWKNLQATMMCLCEKFQAAEYCLLLLPFKWLTIWKKGHKLFEINTCSRVGAAVFFCPAQLLGWQKWT